MQAPAPGAQAARAALADEWRRANPTTPDEIAAFYRTADQTDDLAAWHASPLRQAWQAVLLDVARELGPRLVVDVGCGAGDDLRALRGVVDPEVSLCGVEPSDRFRARLQDEGFPVTSTVAAAPIETADLLICIDVLEHVPDPEAFLGGIARRAQLGALLVESCATHDLGTPLHLRANRGWRTGHALESAGWERTFERGRLRVWQRMAEAPRRATVGLALCAYRGVSQPTFRSVVNLIRNDPGERWRVLIAGEAGIARARSQVTSWWMTETADDVLLMVDDDVSFRAADAERLVRLCREGHDVICAAYPTRDASHLALRGDGGEIVFGPGKEPVEIGCVATGFVAFHRRVFEAMIQTLPICNANLEDAFWPMFSHEVVENEATGGHDWLSEDFFVSELAKSLGFKIWLDPSIILGHQAQVELTVGNMQAIRSILDGG